MDPNVDLLGNNEMPVREPGRGFLASLGTLFFYGVLAIAAGYTYNIAHAKFRDMSEEHQKRAVRRKYGIPDSSNEPFNVAYAKAEKKKKAAKLLHERKQIPVRVPDTQQTLQTSSSYQPIPTQPTPQQRALQTSSLYGTVTSERSPLSRTWYPDRDDNRVDATEDNAPMNVQEFEPAAQIETLHDQNLNRSARHEEDDVLNSSTQDVSLNSLDEELGSAPLPSLRNVRGAKRGAAPVDEIEDIGTLSRKAGKRSRRQSRKVHSIFDENDGGDRLMNLDPVTRGKKRDRAEAGSTFGGDDDSPLSGQGRRKTRRQKRKSDMSDVLDDGFLSRGTKRNFEVESTLDSDDDGSPRRSKISRGLGRRTSDSSEMSLDGPVIEVSCGNHQVGEEWHACGANFRVGQDGRRRRQVLLRRQRSRFSMPKDSQHPDSQEQLEVLVETWLNDDEYDAAWERGDVYEPDPRADLNSLGKNGKQLLYGAPSRANSISRPVVGLPASPVTTSNPFDRPPNGSTRRISLISDSRTSPIATPSIRNSKSYSKWEKQDLEAEAMAKLRQKLEEQKKSEPTVMKKVAFEIPPSSGTSAAPSGATTPSVNGTVATPAPSRDETPAASKTGAFSFGKSDPAPGATSAVPPSATATPGATAASTPSQLKMPTFSLTPPQPSKEQAAPQLARPSLFGGSPTTSDAPAPAEKKETSATAVPSPLGSTVAFPTATPTGATSSFSFVSPAKPDVPSTNKTPAPESTSNTNPPSNPTKPMFAFTKPSAVGDASKVSFGTSSTIPSASASSESTTKPTDQASVPSGKPVFNFSATTKQASPQTPANFSSTGTTPSSFAASGFSQFSTAAAPSASSFAFQTSAKSSGTEQQKTSPFGSSGTAPSPFGNASAAGGSSSTFGVPSTQSKPAPTPTAPAPGGFAFSLGQNGSSSMPAATSSTPAAPASSTFGSSTFGSSTSTSSFGTSPSVFGATAKPIEGSSPFSISKDAPKTVFNFNTGANNSSTSSSTTPALGENKTEKNPASFAFNFNSSPGNAFSNTGANANSNTVNSFGTNATEGAKAAPKPFTFGAGTSGSSPFGTSSNSAFSFGQK